MKICIGSAKEEKIVRAGVLCQMIFLADAAAAGQSPLGDLLHAFPPVLSKWLVIATNKTYSLHLQLFPPSCLVSFSRTKPGSGFPFYFLNLGLDLPVVINRYTEKKENCRSLLW